MSLRTLLLAASTICLAQAKPRLHARDWIASDEIVGFNQTVPDDATGDLYLAYQPYLKVVNGCVPFPGVDAEGDTDAGLSPTGSSDGDCSSNTGQIYIRSNITTTSTPSTSSPAALLYSWYMPKDEPSTGLGHRHDWEGVIIYLSSTATISADNILAVCPSAHGGWDCSTDGYTLSGTKALIKYESIWPLDHSCGLTDVVGGTQPLVAWESLTTAAQDALQTADFDKAIVPFKDSTFDENLAKATY
ncbi:NPP1 family protein [Aspergillus ibericus CBS 121593]|uniref:NPP1 domain protein n=1 Tax=Aspergillus ibericus CBS 121593 TaxID=1448316 RepID=A0A395GPT1_9EURO|nr:NPP1 domain protein [Aspergillus ibericus CBS 121593]RAK96053.1 NPP1 domain protein [Aspergillus ibericus CBS 121593]